MRNMIGYAAVAVALECALSLASCSNDVSDRRQEATVEPGTLTMALETVSASGKVYRLRQATFAVSHAGGFGIIEPEPPPPIFIDGGSVGGFGAEGSGTAGSGTVDAFADAGNLGGFGGFGGFGDPPGTGGVSMGGFAGTGGGSVGGFAGDFGGGGISMGGFPGTGGSISTDVLFLSSESDPGNPVLEALLQPGGYVIQLFDGWFIEQVDGLLGTSAFVDAILLDSPVQFFEIQSEQETFLKFDFEVDGQRVSFGPPGRVIVGIGIEERSGGCGNGVIDEFEMCDGADLNGETCASVTMNSQAFGTLQCSFNCTFDTSGCVAGAGGAGGFDGGGGTAGAGGTF